MTRSTPPLATDPHGEPTEAMAAGVEAAADPYGPPPRPVELVEALARVHELLDLAPEDSTRLGTLAAAEHNRPGPGRR